MGRITDGTIATSTGHTVSQRFHANASNVWFIDERGTVRGFDGTQARELDAVTTRYQSFHYADRALYAVQDLASWLADVREVSERAMAWTGRGELYREAIRYGAQVLVLWGANNARDLQSVGLRFASEQEAVAFVSSFRVDLPKGFRASSSHYLAGRGGVAREYWPPEDIGIEKALGSVLDGVVKWTEQLPEYKYRTEKQAHATDEAAARAFDRLELAWFQRGGRPYEVEWMERRKRRVETPVLDYLVANLDEQEDPRAFAVALLEQAGLETNGLPNDAARLLEHVERELVPARWLLCGQRAGTLTRQQLADGKTAWFDRDHLVIATIETKRNGRIVARIKRAKTAKDAAARWSEITG